MPRTLLEAAATARPVITTDAPDLADKLLRFMALLPEERQAMGERGRAFVEQNFDERLVIGRYLEVVGEVSADLHVGRVSAA